MDVHLETSFGNKRWKLGQLHTERGKHKELSNDKKLKRNGNNSSKPWYL